MKQFTVYILAFLISLTACEKEVTNIKLPSAESKLVVTSFISPQDTLLWVSVMESVPAIGKGTLSSDNIPNATVRMSDGTTSIEFTYDTLQQAYIADARNLLVIPGNTYLLEVNDPKGRKAESSCKVPINQEVSLALAFDSAKGLYGDYIDYHMVLKWQDTPNEANYYRVYAEMAIKRPEGTSYWEVYFDDYMYTTELYSDSRLDGARFSSGKGRISKPSYLPGNPVNNMLHAYLYNTDEHYYRYHKSLEDHYNVDGNPFAEPVLIYSNITGGLGVFAAYNQHITSVPLN